MSAFFQEELHADATYHSRQLAQKKETESSPKAVVTRGNWRKKKKRRDVQPESGRNSCAQNAKALLQHPCSRPSVFSALDYRQNIIFNVSDEMTMALPLCALRPRLRTNIDFLFCIDFIELSQWTSLQLLGAHHAPACCDNTRNRPRISHVSSNEQLHLDAKTISPRSTMAFGVAPSSCLHGKQSC